MADSIINNTYGDMEKTGDKAVYLPGVVSRKKQLVPKIIRGIQQL